MLSAFPLTWAVLYSLTDKILEMSALGKGTVYIVTIGFCRERNVRK